MRRHRSLAVIVASFVLFASQAHGQQPVHRIGVLANNWFPELRKGWLEGLLARGYVEGQNLQIEYRDFQGQADRIPALLAELIAFRPEILVTGTSVSAIAIREAAPAIPLVFVGLGDPVGLGLVKSLSHPDGMQPGPRGWSPKAS